MCTAVSFTPRDHYFGRTLDHDVSFGEEVVVMPRAYPLHFRRMGEMPVHHAIIGMATIVGATPLFYDAVNQCGLAAAGLNFPGNAHYVPVSDEGDNVASFEFIPWILAHCESVDAARHLLTRLRLVDLAFDETMPPAPLHFMLSDKHEDIVVEAMRDGVHIYDNPHHVLTNNPPFFVQAREVKQYAHLRTDNALVKREDDKAYSSYSQGMGAIGLPGDVSSMSRFARAAFLRRHMTAGVNEASCVGQMFHTLGNVAMVRGACVTDAGTLDHTIYTACMNCTRGKYYYTTYGNHRITCVDMYATDLNAATITRYPLLTEESIVQQK